MGHTLVILHVIIVYSLNINIHLYCILFEVGQGAKKVVSNSPGLVDFATRVVISILNLPDRQMKFFGGNSNYRRTVTSAHQKVFRAS